MPTVQAGLRLGTGRFCPTAQTKVSHWAPPHVVVLSALHCADPSGRGSLEPSSPRSVEACLRLGIEPSELHFMPLDIFLARFRERDLAEIAYSHHETVRQVRQSSQPVRSFDTGNSILPMFRSGRTSDRNHGGIRTAVCCHRMSLAQPYRDAPGQPC